MMVQNNNCNFLQWNCRGLCANREEIDLLINEHSPAAFCLQETFLKDNYQMSFKGYNSYFRNTETGHGGVAMLIKNSYIHSKIPLQTEL